MSLNLDGANGGSWVLSSAGLGVGSTTSQISTANVVNYVTDGVYNTQKAAVASVALTVPPQTRVDYTTGNLINVYALPALVPAGNKLNIAVWLDAGGNIWATPGPLTPISALGQPAAIGANPGPQAGNSVVLIGVVSIQNLTYTTNGGFRPGTDALNATVLTGTNGSVTFVNTFDQNAKSF